MRPVLALLVLAFSASNVAAQTTSRWWVISTADPVLSLDTTSVTKTSEGFPRVWVKMVFSKPRGAPDRQFVEALLRVDFNCALRQMRIVQVVSHSATGDIVANSDLVASATWQEITPETLGETELNTVCASRFAHP